MTWATWWEQYHGDNPWLNEGDVKPAWDAATQVERDRVAGHVKNYLKYPALIIEALWHIERGNPIESSMTKEQKEKANAV